MTKDEFKFQFKRLCDGFTFSPSPGQLAAFYERLALYDARDWREAVTDLLCAPRFPKDLNVLAEAVSKRADDRRRIEADQSRMRPVKVAEKAQPGFCDMPDEVRAWLMAQGVQVSPKGPT